MGKLPTGIRKYELSHLWDRHHEIIRRLTIGQSPKRIAEALDITTQTVSDVRNSPIVKARLDMLNRTRDTKFMDISNEIHELAPMAAAILKETMEEDNDQRLKVDVAKDVLDRSGHSSAKNIKLTGAIAHLNMGDLEVIKDRVIKGAKVTIETNGETDYIEQKLGVEDGSI